MNTPDPTLQRLHHIGQLIDGGDLSGAATLLDQAARAAPNDPRIYLMGARLAESANSPKGALDYTRRAVRLSPKWEAPMTELALLLARQNRLTEALEAAQQAVAMAPDSVGVLYRVIDIAHQALNLPLALQWLERAAQLDPDNAEAQRLMAQYLTQLGQYERAITLYTTLLETTPTDTALRLERAKAALYQGRLDLARRDCETLVALDPPNETHRFWLRVVNGEVPLTQPAEMTQALFDGYAAMFDVHLVEGLQYQVPAQVAALIVERYPNRSLDLLDLGCGTGLLGKHLGPITGTLVGVDLSPKMIEQAERLDQYSRFQATDLLTALKATADSHFDVVTACDVFIYSGDLTEVVPQVSRVLRPGGHFIFSCEAAEHHEADLVLRPSTRYAHKASHVRALCAAAGFTHIAIERTTIRVESERRIDGYIAIACKAN